MKHLELNLQNGIILTDNSGVVVAGYDKHRNTLAVKVDPFLLIKKEDIVNYVLDNGILKENMLIIQTSSLGVSYMDRKYMMQPI